MAQAHPLFPLESSSLEENSSLLILEPGLVKTGREKAPRGINLYCKLFPEASAMGHVWRQDPKSNRAQAEPVAWDPALAALEKLISSQDPHRTTCAEH